MPWFWELGRQDARVSQFDGCLKVSTLARSSLCETRNQKPRSQELAHQEQPPQGHTIIPASGGP